MAATYEDACPECDIVDAICDLCGNCEASCCLCDEDED